MNFGQIVKAVDTLAAFGAAARRLKNRGPQPADVGQGEEPPAPSGPGGQVEARLTGVVVAALKEAFNRDHARLELERAHLNEERRRAEAALQAELRRHAVDRELGRLRLLAAAAMVGWIASVTIMAAGFVSGAPAARVVMVVAWLLLLGALGAAFAAQGHVGMAQDGTHRTPRPEAFGTASLWLLLGGLAASAVSLLL